MNVLESLPPIAKRAAGVTAPLFVKSAEHFVLVVMEHGSVWPVHVQGGLATCVILRQEPLEDPANLLRRTYARLAIVERQGGTIDRATLCCNNDSSLSALEGRVPLARALLATVLRSGEGRLELLAPTSAPGRARQSLLALAGTLTEALVGSSATVSARFVDAGSLSRKGPGAGGGSD